MASPKPAFTQVQVIDALKQTNGLQYLAARMLGCHEKTIERMAKRHPAIAEIIKQRRGERVDIAEGMLWKAVEKGEPWAIVFFLKTQAKGRGYSERVEHTGEDGKPIRFIVEVPKKEETAEAWVQQYQKELTYQPPEE